VFVGHLRPGLQSTEVVERMTSSHFEGLSSGIRHGPGATLRLIGCLRDGPRPASTSPSSPSTPPTSHHLEVCRRKE
jgi:hypothetical protein